MDRERFINGAFVAGQSAALTRFKIGTVDLSQWKWAASISQLHGAYRRLPGVVKIPGGTPSHALSINKLKRLMPGMSPGAVQQQAKSGAGHAGLAGKIILPKGGSSSLVGSQTPTGERAVTPAGKKAVNVMTGLHEGFERGVKPSQMKGFAGHLSPDVVMKEHNMVARATGKGSGEAQKVFQTMRQESGEAQTLSDAFARVYGPRAEFTYGEGRKVPKAMRKDFAKRYAKDPDSVLNSFGDSPRGKRIMEGASAKGVDPYGPDAPILPEFEEDF